MQTSTVISCLISLVFLLAGTEYGLGQPVDHRQEMINFVKEISDYADRRNPDFLVIPQNGIQLLAVSRNRSLHPNSDYMEAIDGIARESVFFGYEKDNRATPQSIRKQLNRYLNIARDHLEKIMIVDYCRDPEKVQSSYSISDSLGYVSFAAEHRELDRIPSYPPKPFHENSRDIQSLSDAQNFLYLINTYRFREKEAFINRLKRTNYDLLVIDLFFNSTGMLTTEDISSLKKKANGADRLVVAYMSIGEAEDYRYYWENNWEQNPPRWLMEENPVWEGNYLVKYWMPGWQRHILGSPQAYLDRILNSGFDGVYLDLVDAYLRFDNDGN